MKYFGTFLLLFLAVVSGFGQTDLPQTRQLDISPQNPDKGVSPKGTALRIPAELDVRSDFDASDLRKKKPVKMLPDRKLRQAGQDLVLKPNIGTSENGKSGKHYGNMYLGDFKTSAKFVGIVCRDHEYVDGDRVRIHVNGRVAEDNILLTGSFKGVNIELDKGFNRLEFEALNQGSTGPNTAQVDVYDEKGQLIYSNKWMLSTGSRASMIIVKEAEN